MSVQVKLQSLESPGLAHVLLDSAKLLAKVPPSDWSLTQKCENSHSETSAWHCGHGVCSRSLRSCQQNLVI